jgi:DNA-binding winged helix-turn-helix (wHTH) protein/class 3 adenylate cyclase/tetratricopeptide (TPR) repeat protein
MLYRFQDYQLDPQRYELRQAGQPLKIEPKVFDVLLYLLQHRDRVVSKDELLDHVWPQQFISEATLNSCIMATRRAVGDSGRTQGIIQTVYGRGYRFIAAVEEVPDHDSRPPDILRCPACQHVMSPEAAFCAACGQPRAEEGAGGIAEPPQELLLRPAPVLDVRLCAAYQHVNPATATFCMACGQSLVTASGRPDPVSMSPGREEVRAERKPITVLCCTVATAAEGQARFELEALHSLLQGLRALARDVVQSYGGRLSPVLGDHLYILFGVPMAQEDDARRAVQVALELRQRVSTNQERFGYRGSLTLRMGLHTGLVVIEGGRDDVETTPTVVGDVLSLALALQEQAAPGQILCSDATARLVQGTVFLTAVGAAQLPGQPTPVQAYAVFESSQRRANGRPQLRRGLSPFIDREREMATLHALLAQAESGRGQMVGVVGEAGMGKSRLIAEFRRSLGERRLTYLTGRCLSYGSMTPYLPVLELLRHNCGITEADRPEDITAKIHRSLQEVGMALEEWAPPLLYLLDVQEGTQAFTALSPEARKARTLTALTQMCLQGSRQRPLILEVEDLHWIDASSDEWLTTLVEQMMGVPLLVLATYRPGYRPAWTDRSYATQVALQPLTSEESLQVVQAVLPTAAHTAPLVPRLLATGEGNPFFLEELAQAVVEQGAEGSVLAVPDTVQAVLLARIDRLPASAKSLLQAAAVIGKDIAVPWLQAMTDVPEEAIYRDLRHLQAAEFLYTAHTQTALVYTFKHMLTQEVAYQSLLQRTRRQYHARIAQVLEAQFPEVAETRPELLAQHYTVAGLSTQAITYWQRAGQRAVERSANVEAISHFTKGLEVLKSLITTPEHTQQELSLQLALGSPLMMIKGHTSSIVERTYARAYELAQQLGETPQSFSGLVGLWRFYLSRARLLTARELGEQCFALAERTHDAVLLHEAHIMLGSTLFSLGESVSARAHLEQGIALYDPQHCRSLAFSRGTDSKVVGLARLAWTLWTLGYPDQALSRSYEAIALAQELAHPYSLAFALHFAALVHQYRREAPLVQERAEAAIALASEHGFVLWTGGGLFLRGWALVEQGKTVEEGLAQIRQGITIWLDMGNELGKTHNLASLAEAHGKAGQISAGLAVLAEAFTAFRKNVECHYESGLYRLQGELLLQQNIETDLKSPPSIGTIEARPTHAVPLYVEAESCLHQAIDIARGQQAKSLELRAAVSLAHLWQQQGKREEARQLLVQIYNWFTEGFDTRDLQEARALLEALS